ncbi:MAG: hypothetical protein Sylvanvirus1_77 [Sylvanvirus sp.]|uniref:Uncharacterized protein n=1 Tax=Sylvanvirus sp. TaxID=2487774 RepID=A0A3G5AJD8_9VIRU|nr:MAG: hypothetical protein Sylvanvirus1_77 [Sylvanvirus sp.]
MIFFLICQDSLKKYMLNKMIWSDYKKATLLIDQYM